MNPSESLRYRTWWFVLILSLAFGLRVAGATKWHRDTTRSGQLFQLGDSHSYWILAGHVARGEPYEYGSPDASIFRAPAYPIALAPFTLWQDPQAGIFWARILGCICGTWSVWLIMQLAGRLADDSGCSGKQYVAFASGLLAAVYPGAIGMSIVILSEAIFCPLMLLTLLGWQRGLCSPTLRTCWQTLLVAGMCSGLAILARPSWLLFMPLAGVVTWLLSQRRMHQFLVLCVMALGCVAVMTPWWLRNARLTHRFVPTTLQVGASLYDGLHSGASGGSDENMEFVNSFITQQRLQDSQNGITAQNGQEKLREHSSFEYRLNASMQKAALDWAAKNLSGVMQLSLIKLVRTWSLWPMAGSSGSTVLRLALTTGCLAILLCAAWASREGILMVGQTVGNTAIYEQLARVRVNTWLCWSPAIYFTVLHMVFVGSIRYREPAVLVLTALAGAGTVDLWQRLNSRRRATASGTVREPGKQQSSGDTTDS